MKRILYLTLMSVCLAACDLWTVNPQPFPVWTPIPSRTPGIFTATPLIIAPSLTGSPTSTAPVGPTDTPSATLPAPPTDTSTPRIEMQLVILGCNTGIDITHGMGEVTNAYVTIKNTGTADLPNSCALLRALDEDRVHPDKVRCVDDLPPGHQVNLKLTVDSAYKQDTVIQVDASSDQQLLIRVDQQSCTDIDIIGPIPGDIGVVKPISP